MRSGKSCCGVLYKVVNHSFEQNVMLAGWSFCCVIIHSKDLCQHRDNGQGLCLLSSTGLHTAAAVEWPYVSFV